MNAVTILVVVVLTDSSTVFSIERGLTIHGLICGTGPVVISIIGKELPARSPLGSLGLTIRTEIVLLNHTSLLIAHKVAAIDALSIAYEYILEGSIA